jgi:hypothetical protein
MCPCATCSRRRDSGPPDAPGSSLRACENPMINSQLPTPNLQRAAICCGFRSLGVLGVGRLELESWSSELGVGNWELEIGSWELTLTPD